MGKNDSFEITLNRNDLFLKQDIQMITIIIGRSCFKYQYLMHPAHKNSSSHYICYIPFIFDESLIMIAPPLTDGAVIGLQFVKYNYFQLIIRI